VGDHLRVVAHTPEQTVGDARFAARTPRDLARARRFDLDVQNLSRAMDDDLQIFLRVKIEMKDDAETTAKRCGNETGAGRRTDQRELRQVQLDRAGGRALPDHDVELVILHRGIQDLFDLRLEAMNLVYEENLALLQIGEHGRKVAAAFNRGRADSFEWCVHLVRDDLRKR